MTCIAGLVDNGDVYIGADSAGVNDRFDLTVRADEKVFRNGEFLFGFTSSFRMGQLLRHQLSPPAHPSGMSVDRYMVHELVDAIRECLKAGGYQRTKEGVDTGGTFIVAYRGRLFTVENDYQVACQVEPFCAVGCGYAYARGVLYELRNAKMPPRTKILHALNAAEHFSAGVRGPFKVMKL